MPFVLRNSKTTEVLTTTLINIYAITYHGAKYWDMREDAEREYVELLAQKQIPHPEDWEVIEIEDHQLKVFNVKLKNNPKRKLFVDADGNASATEQA